MFWGLKVWSIRQIFSYNSMCFPAILMLFFIGYRHMHVHPPSFKVQRRLQHYRGSRQTHTNILRKYFVRIWINFWRCEWSMITYFLSVCFLCDCWPIILGPNVYISVCLVWMWNLANGHSHVQRGKRRTAQIQTLTSHTGRISFMLVYQKRRKPLQFCWLQEKNQQVFF